jgi:hypothetical protein
MKTKWKIFVLFLSKIQLNRQNFSRFKLLPRKRKVEEFLLGFVAIAKQKNDKSELLIP